MKFKLRNRPTTATRATLRAGRGDVELAEEVAQIDDCKPDDVSCWVNETLLGGHNWVPHDALQEFGHRAMVATWRSPGRLGDLALGRLPTL